MTARANSIDVLLALPAAGIYRGYMATLYSFGPFSAFYFGFYEQSKSAAVRMELDRKQTNGFLLQVIIVLSC